MIANVGLFAVLPNAFTLLITALSTVSINTQIRLEEEFLSEEFSNWMQDNEQIDDVCIIGVRV